MRIDHVLLGSRSIEALRDRLRDEFGFGICDGSPNPDGTASWIVPMSTDQVQYLEILVTHDENLLAGSEFGRLFLDRTADGPTLLNWAALVDDIEQVAARIAATGASADLLTGESVRADGGVVPWAEAGFAASWATPERPFFLAYGDMATRQERVPVDLDTAAHDRVPTGITGLRVRTADATDYRAWMGGERPGIEIVEDPIGGIDEVQMATAEGPVTLQW
ncbi:hypothetical protein CH275_09565 [Rhodococcus sp. 06-235-1A]|nr:hypothetical protein CH275_09565 [Rhodococcus sp. 06-235-1A]